MGYRASQSHGFVVIPVQWIICRLPFPDCKMFILQAKEICEEEKIKGRATTLEPALIMLPSIPRELLGHHGDT